RVQARTRDRTVNPIERKRVMITGSFQGDPNSAAIRREKPCRGQGRSSSRRRGDASHVQWLQGDHQGCPFWSAAIYRRFLFRLAARDAKESGDKSPHSKRL